MKYILISIITILLFQNCHNKQDKISNNNVKDTIINTISDSIINLKREEINCSDTIFFSKVSVGTNKKWKYEWNYFVASEINNNRKIFIENDSLYKEDLIKLSPKYYDLTDNQKIAFWTLLIASITKFESNFDPNCRFREGASLNYVYSEGLMQLSYGDEKRFNIPLSTEKQNILDPETNLRSGVIIFSKQLKIKNKIFLSKYYYWSVLTNKQNDIILFFQKNSKEFRF